MKKIFGFVAVAVALLVAGNVNAQMGIHAGYAPQALLTTVTYNNTTVSDTASLSGFYAGIDYTIPLSGDLNVTFGLQGRYNTASDSSSASLFGLASGKVKRTDNQFVLDVPILFNYGFDLGGAKLSLFLGPTISYALSGSTKIEGSASVLGIGGNTSSESNWYKADEGNMSALDMSGTAGVILTLSDIRFFLGYNMGLLNLSKSDNTTIKASNLFAGVGYAL